MPVSINYKGRLGNKIFQYVSARIFAEKNKLDLITELPNDVLEFTQHKKFEEDNEGIKSVKVNSKSFTCNEINFEGNGDYIFDDFFQNGDYINENEKLVKSFFILPKKEKNKEDIVMHVRLDDFIHTEDIENPKNWDNSEIVNPYYYKVILEKENFKNLYLVVDKIKYEWEKKYLNYFKEFNPIIISSNPKEDFEFIRNFNKIITSNSTFCYWSAFLSDAEFIYTFGNVGKYGKNLTSHGEHVQGIENIKNKSIIINENFYFGK